MICNWPRPSMIEAPSGYEKGESLWAMPLSQVSSLDTGTKKGREQVSAFSTGVMCLWSHVFMESCVYEVMYLNWLSHII